MAAFQDWVSRELLPAIRKELGYISGPLSGPGRPVRGSDRRVKTVMMPERKKGSFWPFSDLYPGIALTLDKHGQSRPANT